MSRVTVGSRDDLAWAECTPPLRFGGAHHGLVLLQPRDRAESVWERRGPVHVYIYATAAELQAVDHLTRRDMRLLAWGILTDPE